LFFIVCLFVCWCGFDMNQNTHLYLFKINDEKTLPISN
jgi:hypothetical protein